MWKLEVLYLNFGYLFLVLLKLKFFPICFEFEDWAVNAPKEGIFPLWYHILKNDWSVMNCWWQGNASLLFCNSISPYNWIFFACYTSYHIMYLKFWVLYLYLYGCFYKMPLFYHFMPLGVAKVSSLISSSSLLR